MKMLSFCLASLALCLSAVSSSKEYAPPWPTTLNEPMKKVLNKCGVPRAQAHLVSLVEGPPWIIVLTKAQVENSTLTNCLTAELRANHLERVMDWVPPAPRELEPSREGHS